MPHPSADQASAESVLARVFAAAGPYLASLDTRPAYDHLAEKQLAALDGPLPAHGDGAAEVIDKLIKIGTAAATVSSGPRFFHFVTGGVTPAALAADWTTSLLDQNVVARASSAFATDVETIALSWLRELFGFPPGWGGALVASATFANFTGLGCATAWWGAKHGADTVNDGLSGLPRMPVISGGYLHASPRKALQMLGHGRNAATVHSSDPTGTMDLDAVRRHLDALDGAPAVLIATAGEVNAGHFDPIHDLSEIAAEYGAWLHVDAAFGLFAALSPRTAGLLEGVAGADSVAADGHKWLNVPYESGFALLKDPALLTSAFGMPGSAYLPGPDDPAGGYGMRGPESSRRARALPIWATIAAYGRAGHQEMVERHLDLAQRLASLIDASPVLERLAEVPLSVVCFRASPPFVPESEIDDFNRRLGAALLTDGRFAAGLTVYGDKVALRPAIVNWRTTEADIVQFVDVLEDLVGQISSGG